MKITNFINLNIEEKKMILNWRNHPDIARYMITKHISLKEHLQFIENLKKNLNKKYFLIEDIGVIYFTIFKNYAEIGLYKNPQKKGVGKILMEKLIDYGFNKLNLTKLILYVYEDNLKAINLYKKFGFTETDKKDNLIKMELKNANRKI